ncbi:zinc-ribbon domain-containing protein [Haloarchaeobius sp. HRN-SO-5]|uniref:zinc ribbon domain-containing protein n=1 Tax=Haloarchaeobius sp. HRN-SO-5 TaxID=3446118 RepID=UPI003EB901EF
MGPANADRDATAPPYCSQCGSRLGPAAKYCPQCGSRVGERAGSSSDRDRPARDPHDRTGPAREERDAEAWARRVDEALDGWVWSDQADRSREDRRSEAGGAASRQGDDDAARNDRARERAGRWPPRNHWRRGGPKPESELDEGDRRLRDRIELYVHDGWDVDEHHGDSAVLVDRTYGGAGMHLLVAATTIWWTSGLGNAAYAAHKYYADADRLVLQVRDGPDGPVVTEHREQGSSTTGRRVAGFLAGLLLLFLFVPVVVALAVGFGELSLVILAGAVCIAGVLAAVVGAPGDHSPTEFGRTRAVEERAIEAPDQPCTACLSTIDRGVERTYRDEFLVAGVPVKTYEMGRNHYCVSCAQGETDVESTADAGSTDESNAPAGAPEETANRDGENGGGPGTDPEHETG